jgi:farnesyl-diphosphate farnesyltransferase
MSEIEDLLQKTSRTFALTIPFLPAPTRAEVEVAYLLFRVIDTFEDARLWTPERRADTLRRFCDLIEREPDASAPLAAECQRDPPVSYEGYLELLSKLPFVLGVFSAVRAPARACIRRHVTRSAERMAAICRRCEPDGKLALLTLDDLGDYCYSVAGIVGEMLTELYLIERAELDPVAAELRAGSAEFGEGLQLVNILKDAARDAEEGRSYLPKQVSLVEVFARAERDLAAATRYVECLRRANTQPGVIAFNASISRMAIANLGILRTRGLGAKLSRLDVARIQADVMRMVQEQQSATPHTGQPAYE